MVSWQENVQPVSHNTTINYQSLLHSQNHENVLKFYSIHQKYITEVVECSERSRQKELEITANKYLEEVAYQFHNAESIVPKYFHLQHDHLTVSYL